MPIALATARANNVIVRQRIGDALRSHGARRCPPRSRPGCRPASRRSCSGRPPTPRAERRRSPMRSTAARAWRCAGLSCSWLCGTGASGDAAIDLGGLADGPHSITVYASVLRRRRLPASGPFPFTRRSHRSGAAADPRRARSRSHASPGWWGHAPIALSLSTGTAADVVSSRLRVYGPAGALVLDETSAGALAAAAVPAARSRARPALYGVEVARVRRAGRTARRRRAPPSAGTATRLPCPSTARRRRSACSPRATASHLVWPDPGRRGGPQRHRGRVRRHRRRRRLPLAPRPWPRRTGRPARRATSESAISGRRRSTASQQVCLAIRPISGAGVAAHLGRRALRAGRRAAAGGDAARRAAPGAAERRPSRSQSSDAERCGVLGGAARRCARRGASATGRSRSPARARTCCARSRATARATRPSWSARSAWTASAPSIGERDGRLRRTRGAGRRRRCALGRRARRGAPGRRGARDAALGRRPHGGRPRAGRPARWTVPRSRCASSTPRAPPTSSERSATLPVRSLPVLRGLRVARRPRHGPPGDARARPRARCAPTRRAVCRISSARYPVRADGTFAVRVHPRRTHALRRGGAREPEAPADSPERAAGTAARDGAHRGAAGCACAATAWSCAPASTGRGEATRLHLLVHDVRGGRWVEGCLEHGRPGVHLERTGRVRRHLSHPAERARPRLDVPPGARGAVQHLAVAHAVERVAAACCSRSRDECGTFGRPRATPPVKAAIGAARTGRRRVGRTGRSLGRVARGPRPLRLRTSRPRHAAGRLSAPPHEAPGMRSYGRK